MRRQSGRLWLTILIWCAGLFRCSEMTVLPLGAVLCCELGLFVNGIDSGLYAVKVS